MEKLIERKKELGAALLEAQFATKDQAKARELQGEYNKVLYQIKLEKGFISTFGHGSENTLYPIVA